MKNKDIKILILYVLFFFVAASCSSPKKNKSAIALSDNTILFKEIQHPSSFELDSVKLQSFYQMLNEAKTPALQYSVLKIMLQF